MVWGVCVCVCVCVCLCVRVLYVCVCERVVCAHVHALHKSISRLICYVTYDEKQRAADTKGILRIFRKRHAIHNSFASY